MANLVLRSQKGEALTWEEGDANLINLNNELQTKITNPNDAQGVLVNDGFGNFSINT